MTQDMQYTRLGRTNENVSVVGLGCGGHSRLGMARGASNEEASRIVKRALDLGVTFIDTARVYGTEEAVGIGIQGHDRSKLFISTKVSVGPAGGETDPVPFTVQEYLDHVDACLKRLGTDYVDLLHIHGVAYKQWPHAREVLVPVLEKLKEQGKIRFTGVTEIFRFDTEHSMLREALPHDDFDVAMVGFNLLNQTARKTIFPLTQKYDVGTLIMFAVRRGLNSVPNTVEAVAELIDKAEIDPALINPDDPLDFLRDAPGVKSQVEAAYRFCRHEPGADVILTGTGSVEHLEENIQSILAPPLPDEVQTKLEAIFGEAVSASAN